MRKYFLLALIIWGGAKVSLAQEKQKVVSDSTITVHLKKLQQHLGLNNQQVGQLRVLYREFRQQEGGISASTGLKAGERQNKIKEMMAQQDLRLKQILTPAQYRQFKQERQARAAQAMDSIKVQSLQRKKDALQHP